MQITIMTYVDDGNESVDTDGNDCDSSDGDYNNPIGGGRS